MVLIPVFFWLGWKFTPKKKLLVAIIDKTSYSQPPKEHISLTWILDHNQYLNEHHQLYQNDSDYFGFFPIANGKYRIKGISQFSPKALEKLSQDYDIAYYADTYGIYSEDLHLQKARPARPGLIYGGMSQSDIHFLQLMKEKRKLIIAEFNTLGDPTSNQIRMEFEQMFHIHWTGWDGKYFELLDTLKNNDLPHWLVANYKMQHHGMWPFHHSGIVFVNQDGRIVILENGIQLNEPLPHIITPEYGQYTFGLPGTIKYAFWFDIVTNPSPINQVISSFSISTNQRGSEELAKYGIPRQFPAIIRHMGSDYHFYYFSGDFCSSNISIFFSHFKWLGIFKFLFYDTSDPVERKSFFWKFYKPLMTNILYDDYLDKKGSK
ncbi:MAG: hypothetical protein ACYCOO_12525 [Chitinophagaceae bacterium]